MAVQAQYPSNILLLNRSVEEEKPQLGNNDYSLQPSGGGREAISTFLDHQSQNQNHILFNNFRVGNCSGNQRKRGREISMNQFMAPLNQQQSHSNQFVDISQLHSRNFDVSTGLHLTFNDQKRSLSPQFSDLSTLINQQRQEIEHYLQSQGEEFRRILAEKRQRRYCAILGAAEESAARLMREKEAEVETAVRQNSELEARVAQLSAEAQVWETRARTQEAVAAALQAQLQQAAGGLRCAGGEAEDAESAYDDSERVVVASGPGCKACGERVASVVLLPCRHLCVCSECNGVVQACPLCLTFRTSSIEVHMA